MGKFSTGYRMSKRKFLRKRNFNLAKAYHSGRIRSGLSGIRARFGWNDRSKGYKRKRYYSRSWS